MIIDIIRFLWSPRSYTAVCVMIHVAEYLSQKDRLQVRDYLESQYEACKPRGIS